ncbi:MAG: histidine phosphatase family protein [Candidatus Pacebacteria bacterium]|nr:histidine phosphatase family protein [Candidatus Paceibacterota bacterium]
MGILYLARHGQTDHNLNEIYMGQRDIELNETGRKQARKLGRELRDKGNIRL